MRSRRVTDALFWLLAAVAVVAVVGFGLLLAGALPVSSAEQAADLADEPGSPDVATAPKLTTRAATTTPARTTSPRSTSPRTTPAATTAPPRVPPPARPRLATVVVSASRGDCWIQARVGSATGEVLEETVIAQGDSVRIRAARVWLTLGASGNVDVTVNGKPRPVSPGTVAVVLQPQAA